MSLTMRIASNMVTEHGPRELTMSQESGDELGFLFRNLLDTIGEEGQ